MVVIIQVLVMLVTAKMTPTNPGDCMNTILREFFVGAARDIADSSDGTRMLNYMLCWMPSSVLQRHVPVHRKRACLRTGPNQCRLHQPF